MSLFLDFFPQNLTVLLLTYYAKQGWIQKRCFSFLVLPLVWKIRYINIFKCWCFKLRFRYSTNKSRFFQIEPQTCLTWWCFKASLGKTVLALSISPHMKGLPNPWLSLCPFEHQTVQKWAQHSMSGFPYCFLITFWPAWGKKAFESFTYTF